MTTHDVSNQEMEQVIDLSEKTCPNKEDRIGSIKNYYGKVTQLIDDTRKGCLQWEDRPFQQVSVCLSFMGALRIMAIKDAVVIIHSPIGCGVYFNAQRELYRNIPYEFGLPRDMNLHSISTNLTEDDIVHGGADKLRETIILAEDRYHPKSIFIITSCASGIMGDDIEGVVNSVQPEINAIIVPVRCEGFRSKIMQTSYDAIWHGVLKYLVRKPRRKQEDLVNIASSLNTVWSERLEASRLLGKMGLRANLVPELATTEQLQYLSEAAVSAPTCPSFTDYLYKGLKQEYGVPYFRSPIPIGVKNTDNWLRKIAEYTGKEDIVEKVIHEEHEVIDPQIEELRERLKGQKIQAVDIGGQSRALGLPTICAELGIEVTGTVVWEHDDLLADDLEERYKECGDFDILVADIQSYEQSMLLKKLKPDLYTTCSFLGTVTKGDYVSVRHHSFRPDYTPFSPMLFYNGTLAYGNLLLRQIMHPGLQRTVAERVTQPFRQKLYTLPLPLVLPYVSPDDHKVASENGEVV